jgi:hypothetical protein
MSTPSDGQFANTADLRSARLIDGDSTVGETVAGVSSASVTAW